MIPKKIYGPSVSLQQVSLVYGNNRLLDNINCSFTEGQWHGIIGPNGGGKSSLLKTILGLQAHTGQVEIHWLEKYIGELGYVPQMLPFDVSLPISCRDFLLMSLRRKPLWFNRTLSNELMEALALVNIENKLERKLGELSGGERQRLLLASALLKQPQLLLLDEPMTGLDQQGREEVISLLSRFHQAGGTIIMVEHHWELIQRYCDKVYRIDQKISEIDLNKEIQTNPNIAHSA